MPPVLVSSARPSSTPRPRSNSSIAWSASPARTQQAAASGPSPLTLSSWSCWPTGSRPLGANASSNPMAFVYAPTASRHRRPVASASAQQRAAWARNRGAAKVISKPCWPASIALDRSLGWLSFSYRKVAAALRLASQRARDGSSGLAAFTARWAVSTASFRCSRSFVLPARTR